MGLQPDSWIRKMAQEHKMIEPFAEWKKLERVISYGVSSYGYDARLADTFQLFVNNGVSVIDPKLFDPQMVEVVKANECIIPPNSFALARTVEYFRIPRNVMTISLGKSTYARCGLVLNVTPFEPEWEGHATLELSNTTTLPIKVYANEGIIQVLFFTVDAECEISYADKRGVYQAQVGITPPMVRSLQEA